MSDKRAAILSAAAHCIARQGVRGLRVHDVAREAGVSTALLYYHFGDRDGLLAATLDHVNGAAGTHRLDGSTESGLAHLESLLLGEIQDREDVWDNSVAWNELRATAVFEPAIREAIHATSADWNADIRATLESAYAESPHDDRLPVGQAAVVLTALVEGLSGRWLSQELSADDARVLLRDAIHRLVLPHAALEGRP